MSLVAYESENSESGSDQSDTEAVPLSSAAGSVHGKIKLALPEDFDSVYQHSRYSAENVRKRVEAAKDPGTRDFKRRRQHEPGRWPSHIYLQVEVTDAMTSLAHTAIKHLEERLAAVRSSNSLKNQELSAELSSTSTSAPRIITPRGMGEGDGGGWHMSLCKPFSLRKHQLEAILEALKKRLRAVRRFRCEISGDYEVLVNEDKSLSFCCLCVVGGQKSLLELVEIINSVLGDFKQAPYYEDPKFHISVASAEGDITTSLSDVTTSTSSSNAGPVRVCEDTETVVDVEISCVQVSIGNDVVTIPLGE